MGVGVRVKSHPSWDETCQLMGSISESAIAVWRAWMWLQHAGHGLNINYVRFHVLATIWKLSDVWRTGAEKEIELQSGIVGASSHVHLHCQAHGGSLIVGTPLVFFVSVMGDRWWAGSDRR